MADFEDGISDEGVAFGADFVGKSLFDEICAFTVAVFELLELLW